jgi:hypothetical protein
MPEMFESVPRAERLDANPFIAGGGSRETVWENPTDTDIVLPLHCGSTVTAPVRKPTYMERYGIERVVIPARKMVTLPSSYDMAIQDTHCKEPECVANRRGCRDPKHHKTIVGGLGPHLINRGMTVRPEIHPTLDAHRAEYERSVSTLKDTEAAAMKADSDRRLALAELDKINKQIEDARARQLEFAAASSAASFVPPPKKSP